MTRELLEAMEDAMLVTISIVLYLEDRFIAGY
jgi:hypothetical protein